MEPKLKLELIKIRTLCVGLGSSGLLPYYIVECLDNTLPNETYPYKFVSMPLSEIFTDLEN